MTLAVAYEGVAVPLFWCLLNKAGNATAIEHRAMLVRFIRLFGKACILGVLADREFVSATLFGFCNTSEIPFYIRIKEGAQVKVKCKKWLKAQKLFSHLNLRKKAEFQMTVTHLVDRARIKKLMALLAIGFCWAHRIGEWRASIKPIRLCKHHDSTRPQNSYMRYGLDYIREIIINPFKKIREFRRVLALFSPEPTAQGVGL